MDSGMRESLAQSSLMFEQAGVTIPILSVYEGQRTKLRKSIATTTKILVRTPQVSIIHILQ